MSLIRRVIHSRRGPNHAEARPAGTPSTRADQDRLGGTGHGEPGARHQPAQHVAADVVGAEQVRLRSALQDLGRCTAGADRAARARSPKTARKATAASTTSASRALGTAPETAAAWSSG